MRTLLSLLFLGVGVTLFAYGSSRNPVSPARVSDFVSRGLEDGSLWFCVAGAVIACFGGLIYLDSSVRKRRAEKQP